MTLTLAEPDANPIRTYANGLKVVRLTDYIGAARGTLSTVADSAAVAGNVVKDTQTVAIPTTFADQFGSVADTVTIPVADFDYGADSNYTGYLAVRCDGRPPVTARAAERFNTWFSNATPNVTMGYDGVPQGANVVPREIYANYCMIGLGGFGPSWDGSSTNVNIRAWGIAGSSPAFAWYLDCLYLIPLSLASTDTGASALPGNYSWYIGQSFFEPYPENIATDDENNTSLNKKSVFFHQADVVLGEDGSGFDIQDEGSVENTEFDWRRNWFSSDRNKTLSYIYWVGLTSRLINTHQIAFSDFSDTLPDPSPAGPYNQTYVNPDGYQFWVSNVGVVGEYYFAAGVMRFRSFSVAYGEIPPGYFPRGTSNFGENWSIGAYTHNLNTFNAADPRTYTPTMESLESFIMTHKCIPTDGIATSGMTYWSYGERWTGENTFITRIALGPKINIQSSGSATVQFAYQPNNTVATTTAIGPSVSVPDNLSTPFWIKLERRLYEWRFKIWLDGNSEPSDWLLTVNEPATIQSSVSGTNVLLFPWETGFPTTGTKTYVNVPDRLTDEFTLGSTDTRGWTPGGSIILPATFSQQAWRFDIDDITIEYDPDSESEGTYTDSTFQLEKYDGSEFWGSVTVDPGMCRVAFSDYAPHHFDNSTHGGNIIAYKDSGGHPLQTAAYGVLWFRRYVQGDIPLFRPRVFSVRA